MNEARPSLARQLSIVAMAILATILAAGAAFLPWILWTKYVQHDTSDLWTILISHLRVIPPYVAACGAGTLIASPLLVRVARISKLWHCALLATAAAGATFVLLQNDRMAVFEEILMEYVIRGRWEFGFVWTVVPLQVIHTALGSLVYGMARHQFRRGSKVDPAPTEPSSIPDRLHRFGTRAEIRIFSLIVAGILLAAGGGALAIREMLLSQIPPAVWKLLREPAEMTLLTFQRYSGRPGPPKFHGRDVAGELQVETEVDRAAILTCVERSVGNWWRRDRSGSGGTYGLRVADGTTSVNMVMAFDTQRLAIVEDDKIVLDIEFHGLPTEIEALLRAADIPVAATPGETGILE